MSTSKSTKQRNIERQMSSERDFTAPGIPTVDYVICCNHRTGSNLLSEALYRTGLAGDPMEYLNIGFLRAYARAYNIQQLNFRTYFERMRARRTSPNGVFGMNVKFDQIQANFGQQRNMMLNRISQADVIIFLYRENKLKQAISAYKGRYRDEFNVLREDEMPKTDTSEVPFNFREISRAVFNQTQIDNQWEWFFQQWGITPHYLSYEYLVANYEQSVRDILGLLGVEPDPADIPEPPTVRVSDSTNERLARAYLAKLDPDRFGEESEPA